MLIKLLRHAFHDFVILLETENGDNNARNHRALFSSTYKIYIQKVWIQSNQYIKGQRFLTNNNKFNFCEYSLGNLAEHLWRFFFAISTYNILFLILLWINTSKVWEFRVSGFVILWLVWLMILDKFPQVIFCSRWPLRASEFSQ